MRLLAVLAIALSGCAEPPRPILVNPQAAEKIEVSSVLDSFRLLRMVKPRYPEEARRQGIQGVVRIRLKIGKIGIPENLVAIEGNPILVPAALDAVRQWRYEPTLINHEPVEVITQVDVNFTLNQ